MVARPCYNLTVGKVDEHMKLCLRFTNTKIYSLLHFLSRSQENEREYESWVNSVNWTKRKTSWRERESWHRPWIFFLYFLMLVSSSQVHICETPFRSSPQNRGHNFWLSSQYWLESTYIFTFHIPKTTPSQTRVVPLLLSGVRARTYLLWWFYTCLEDL